jgi:hypothetical protein
VKRGNIDREEYSATKNETMKMSKIPRNAKNVKKCRAKTDVLISKIAHIE